MNKYKKLAVAAVSLVMAGTMVASLAACGPTGSGGGNDIVDVDGAKNVLNEDGSLNYDVYKRGENGEKVTLNIAIGHENAIAGTQYNDVKATILLPDGNTYGDGQMKPAWVQMGKDLNINWVNKWDGSKTSENLGNLLKVDESGSITYNSVDMFTSDLAKVVERAGDTDILNLADYLDKMPNFAKFLNDNPIVYLSLLQTGMSTVDGSNKTLYVAPYFDGNDDIERYCIIRHDWAQKLLDGETSLTGGTAWGKTTYVQPYFKAGYSIESLTSDGSGKQTITKDYAAAKTALASSESELGKAYAAIAGSATYPTTGTGNIVDIMNEAIKANNSVSGEKLVDLYRAYIDVAYKSGTNAAYAKTERSHLFTGYDAAWDADDLVAILRCVMTNASALGVGSHTVGGIMPRSGQNDRTPDMVRLAAQLYGARGAESRLEYTYIDNDGNIQDARNDANFYQAMVNFHTLQQEGLIANYSNYGSFSGACGVQKSEEYFMMYDYSQTQTLNGFYVEDGNVTVKTNSKGEKDAVATDGDFGGGYYFAPILTPVSQWDVDGDGNYTDIMRFTESWRSTKTGGLAVNGAVRNDPDKLNAVLQFIDYLYHQDGQIVSTYGPMAEDATGTNGFWYNEVAEPGDTETFTYKGVTYHGTEYKDYYTPTITENVYKSFKGLKVTSNQTGDIANWKVTDATSVAAAKLSFTNYARYLIGSTLPIGIKDQSFENQLTSLMGQAGAGKVGAALKAGVIHGMSLNIDENNYWYTVVPTGLPHDLISNNAITATSQAKFKYMSGDAATSSKDFYSVFNWIILYGLGGSYTSNTVQNESLPATAAEMATKMSELGGSTREGAWVRSWNSAKDYWNYLKPEDAE